LTQTYKINIDLGTASAAMYLHPDAARVVKF